MFPKAKANLLQQRLNLQYCSSLKNPGDADTLQITSKISRDAIQIVGNYKN